MSNKQLGTGIMIVVGIGIVFAALTYRATSDYAPQPVVQNFSPHTICEDAFDENYNFSQFTGNHFVIHLKEGCFGPVVYMPTTWHHWEEQPSGDQNGWWWSIWIVGENVSHGPIFADARPNYTYNKARFQGHGNMIFYTNDVP